MTEHPFSRIPEGKLRLFVVPIAGVSLVLLVVIVELVQRGPGWLPFGDLVLSFTTNRATEALSTWSVEDRVRIAFINGLDYLFGPLYANLLALGCIWAGRLRDGSSSWAGSTFAWLAWVLLLLDIPENIAYLKLVSGESGQPWPLISGTCVLIRTGLVVASLGFMARCLKQSKAQRAVQHQV
jgi:hypothetical protein